jgi:sulfite exporter TauE/SafE
MHGVLQNLGAWCGSVPLAGGTLLGLFLAGLAGSPLHCGPMCGGFVLGQVADRMAQLPVAAFCAWSRLRAGALVPYHLGRLTTYAALGSAAGLGGLALRQMAWFAWASSLLLLAGAGLFLLHALRAVAPRLWRRLVVPAPVPARWARGLHRWTAGRTRPLSGYVLGLVLGLLPCGFLYAALLVAATGAGPVYGALSMAAFGAGTIPALVAVGVAGQAAGQRFRRGVTALAPAVLTLNAVLLAALALRGLA